MKLFTIALLLITTMVSASSNDLLHRPRSFRVSKGSAVFVNFTNATYNITYDITQKSASVVAVMEFDAPESGFPVFDSVTEPKKITLDGREVSATEIDTPSKEATVRVLNKAVETGHHTLRIEMPIKALVEFDEGNVKSAFWTSDLSSRNFLERYLPASFEYDQVSMIFNVKFIGNKKEQLIYTNGEVSKLKDGSFKITYPDYYNVSSIFYHTVPVGSVDETRFTIKSLDGRELPVVIYYQKSMWNGSGDLNALKTQTIKVIQELESDYGAFPHPSVIVYNAGFGGMEYCGATMTEFRALGHELFHSYFARGVMPANGNSGWLDEALASWRDNGYERITKLIGSSMMSAHPYYTRTTDRAAYSFGERFMALMDGKFAAKGGIKPFMRHMLEKRIFAPLFVEEFAQEMGNFYGESVEADFKKYTYDSKNDFSINKSAHSEAIHRKMTIEELKNYL